jgi:putative transposase
MARLARVVAVDVPHHVTQRGNGRRFILDSDSDRAVYLELLRHHCQLHRLSLAGFCLMSNHVHLIAIPQRPQSLALALKNTHGRYAAYFNARYLSVGHVWQGRYYSCPLDTPHLWAALRYVERNPLRAGLAPAPEDYFWSSAALHCGRVDGDGLVDLTLWRAAWTPAEWRAYLAANDGEQDAEAIRRSTHTGRPLGTPEFVADLERALQRILRPQPGGRPEKQPPDHRQTAFGF